MYRNPITLIFNDSFGNIDWFQKEEKKRRGVSSSIRELINMSMQYDSTRVKREKKMIRSPIPPICKSVLPSSKQYHFADCIPNASQRNITFCDIPHSKSFIWDELIKLVLRVRAKERNNGKEGIRCFTWDAAANRGEIISLNYVIGIVSNVHLAHCRPLRSFHIPKISHDDRTRKINTSH